MPRYVRVLDSDVDTARVSDTQAEWMDVDAVIDERIPAEAGMGDVVGPVSATDNAFARYNLTTGKLIQNSLVTADDTGSVNIPTGQAYKINGTALAKGDVGLGNVDNVSDAGKPVSTAQQTALDLKANDADVVHSTGDETIADVKTFSSDPIIPDEIYGVGWDGSLEPPTKNAVYDKIEMLGAAGIGGSTGATDNAILRADGAGGATAQGSNLTVGDDGAAIVVSAVGAAADIGITLTPKGTTVGTSLVHVPINNGRVFLYSIANGYGAIGFNSAPSGTNYALGGDGGTTIVNGSIIKFRINNSDKVEINGDGTFILSADSGFTRNAAGVVEVNNGTAGNPGTLLLRGMAFGSLPAVPVTGMRATVIDSSTAVYRATIAGGGANIVPAFFDGTNWIVS